MAMDGSAMGQAVADAAAAVNVDPTKAITPDQLASIWKAACGEMVKHLQSNADVLQGIPVSTTGGPAAQTGSTTAPGKIA